MLTLFFIKFLARLYQDVSWRTQGIHNCACTTVCVHLVQWVVYLFNCLESTYGCYPTKWQFGQKLFFFFNSGMSMIVFYFTMQLWTYHPCFSRSGERGNVSANTLCCYRCGIHDNQPLAVSSLRWISCYIQLHLYNEAQVNTMSHPNCSTCYVLRWQNTSQMRKIWNRTTLL